MGGLNGKSRRLSGRLTAGRLGRALRDLGRIRLLVQPLYAVVEGEADSTAEEEQSHGAADEP